MILGSNSIQETYYEILSVKEEASHEEIRANYRSAILASHPDKLHSKSASEERFIKIQKAWEVVGNSRTRAAYDSELRASRRGRVAADDITLEDMAVESAGGLVQLFYKCRCGDCFSVDSSELREMGYVLSKNETEVSIQTADALPASIILPCGSCSLQVCLIMNPDSKVTVS